MRTASALLIGLMLPWAAWAEEPVITFSVDMRKEAVYVGEPARARITAKYPKAGAVAWPVIGSEWKEVSVERFVESSVRIQNGSALEERVYWLSGFTPGEHILETGKFVYYRLDGKEESVAGPQLKITVLSHLPEQWQALDIKPIKPAVIIVPPWLLAALAVSAAAAAAFWIGRRKQRQASAVSGPPPRPAHVLALEALEQLRRDELPQRGEWKQYYIRLSGIVRAYIERRFQLRAPEMTTEEFLKTATQASALSLGHQGLLRDFLAQSDLVKFAKYQPSHQEAQAAFEAALRFVHETMPVSVASDAAAAAAS